MWESTAKAERWYLLRKWLICDRTQTLQGKGKEDGLPEEHYATGDDPRLDRGNLSEITKRLGKHT